MAIDTLYDDLDRQRIRLDVAEALAECETREIPPNQRRYFSALAKKYGLAQAVMEQLRTGTRGKDIATNTEIAELFGARHYTSVANYLKRQLHRNIYHIRITLCLEEGGRRGGEACTASEIKHQLTEHEKNRAKNARTNKRSRAS